MSFPIGTALTALFSFFKSSVLTDPSAPPTIVNATYPDFSLLTPIPALTHVRTGQYSATVFTAGQVLTAGNYQALAYTTDATLDNQVSLESWEVESAASGSVDVKSFSGAAATQVTDIQTHVDLIGTGTIFSPVPVGTDGATTIVRGSSYYVVDGTALTYVFSGYPAFDVGTANAQWRALDTKGHIVEIVGDTTAIDKLVFELSPAQSDILKTGSCSKQATIAGSLHTVKSANESLTVLNSV